MENLAKTVAMPSRYTVWDLETTGLDPQTCRIVEVAAIVVENGEVVESYSAILNHDIDIPEGASAVHGITREKCAAEGVSPASAIDHLLVLINRGEACVTHNGIRFDAPFLMAELEKLGAHGITVSKTRARLVDEHLDTAVMYKANKLGIVRGWNEPFENFANRVMEIRAYGVKYNVGVCCDELGIDRSQITQHRALGDVTLTNEIYKKLAL